MVLFCVSYDFFENIHMKKDSGTNLNIFEDNLKRGAGSIGGVSPRISST